MQGRKCERTCSSCLFLWALLRTSWDKKIRVTSCPGIITLFRSNEVNNGKSSFKIHLSRTDKFSAVSLWIPLIDYMWILKCRNWINKMAIEERKLSEIVKFSYRYLVDLLLISNFPGIIDKERETESSKTKKQLKMMFWQIKTKHIARLGFAQQTQLNNPTQSDLYTQEARKGWRDCVSDDTLLAFFEFVIDSSESF